MEQQLIQLKKSLLTQGRLKAVSISNSMAPLFQAGDAVSVEVIPTPTAIKRFDVIIFWNGRELVGHYVIGPSSFHDHHGPVFHTKGLKSNFIDLPVPWSAILGRVAIKIPFHLRLLELFKLWRLLRSYH